MKRKMWIGCGVLILGAAVWIGARNINATAETEDVKEENVVSVLASTGESEELTEDSLEELEAVEHAAETDGNSATDDSEEGVLYSIKTSNGNNIGMVPIVNGSAVVLLDGSYATTYQGDYMPEELDAFALKLENVNAQIASNGKIGEWSFYREAMLKEFEIPAEVTAIEKFAFARSNLSSVVIPEGVTSIGYGAFYHCDALSEVTIPDSVTTIEENAFSHTLWLKNWMAGGGESEEETEKSDFLIVGDGILLAYRGSEENPALPEEVKSVVPGALGE